MTTDSLPRQMGRCVCSFVTPPLEAERVEALTAFVARRKAEGGAPTDFLSALPPHGDSRMRLHAAVAAMFFAFGIGAGLWGGASGAILIRAGVDAATFGILLTVYTSAYLISMSAGGAVAHRFGVDRALSVSAILLGAAVCALLDASSEAWVAIALIVAGFLGGIVDLLMNAEGARIERRLGRPILARLHAAASAGMALGAILGSLIAASAAPWTAGLLAALVLALAGVAYYRAARTDPVPSTAVGSVGRGGLSFAPVLIGLGLLLGVSIAAELAASLWSTLLLHEEAPKLAAISGLGAAFFSGCQAAPSAFNADVQFALASAIFASSSLRSLIAAPLGFALVSVQAGFAASVAGFALIGVGTGPIVPCGFALAARQSAAGPAVGLASASLFSALSRLPAPLMTGAVAQALSLPIAFGAFGLALAATAAATAIIAFVSRARRSARKA